MHPTPPTATAAPVPLESGQAPQPHNEITRHLATAVQRQPDFANRVIKTYVTAPQEALPPAPGVDARTILTQALVARRRRGVRDTCTLVLLLLTALVLLPLSPGLVLFFIGFWTFWSVVAFVSWIFKSKDGETGKDSGVTLGAGATVLLFIVWLVIAAMTSGALAGLRLGTFGEIGSTGVHDSYSPGYETPEWLLPALVLLLSAAVIYFVLLTDKLVLRHLLAVHGSSTAPPKPAPLVSGLVNWLTTTATRRYERLLTEVDHRSASGNVLMHGGWDCFVGYGERISAWTLPLTLRARDQQSHDVPVLRPQEIYGAVNDELATLCDADRLAPGQRFRELSVFPLITASSRGLRKYRSTALGQELLPDESGRPVSTLSSQTLSGLMDQSPEWVRHFLHSTVSSWDSDLVVSTFLNIGCDDRTLYLEWNTYCLFPLAPRFRESDQASGAAGRAALAAAGEFLRLPGNPGRRWRAISNMVRAVITEPPLIGMTDPDNFYGRVESIREMAAAGQCGSEFQDLDGYRHMKVLEQRTLSAIHHHLKERGYDTERLDQYSSQIINNHNHHTDNSQFISAHSVTASGNAHIGPDVGKENK